MGVDNTGRFETDTYHGSNSWIILSKRITANSLEEKPASHARSNTVNVIRLFHPDGFTKEFFSSLFSTIFYGQPELDTSFILHVQTINFVARRWPTWQEKSGGKQNVSSHFDRTSHDGTPDKPNRTENGTSTFLLLLLTVGLSPVWKTTY